MADLLAEHDPSLVALQEAVPDAEAFLSGRGYGGVSNSGTTASYSTGGLTTAYRTRDWRPANVPFLDYGRALGTLLTSISGSLRLRVCNVHLPSWLSGSDAVRSRELGKIVRELDDVREREQGASELILGDFNLDPYAPAVVDRGVLNSNRGLGYVRRRTAGAAVRSRPLFNIGWRLLGLHEDAIGTCYYTSSEADQPWHVYDHASVTPDLADQGAPDAELVVEVRNRDLRRSRTRGPDAAVGSDHYPVVWTLRPSAEPG